MINPLFKWQPPIPLRAKEISELPGDVFPGEIQTFIVDLAKSTETPVELAALTTLSGIATAAQGKYIVQVKPDYVEPLNIWTAVALPPGCRKSAVQTTVIKPILKYEEMKKKEYEPLIAEIASKNKNIEARIKEIRQKSAKAKQTDFECLQKEIFALESQIKEVPLMPQLWTTDVTPENLATLMVSNHECMAILSDEAGIFDILSGRYSSGIPNLDLFLKAYSGSPTRVNRGGRPPDFLNRPALTMGLTPQPDVLRGLGKTNAFRGRGLLSRFLYAIPSSNLGSRSLDTVPLSKEVEQKYHEIITSILYHPIDNQSPHTLKLTEKAFETWRLYALAIEIKMDDEGQFAHITDWAGKLPGQIIRVAGLLHVARYSKSQPWIEEIKEADMLAAIRICDFLSTHALAVFELMGADPSLDGAKAILRWIEKTQCYQFTFRDCHYAHKNRFKKAKDMEACMEILKEHYFIQEREAEKKPHRPSRVFEVNPYINSKED